MRGFSLVELIIAIGIFAILGSGVVYIITNSYSNFQGTGDRQTVSKFAQEGIEAVRAIRDNSWQSIEDAVGSATGIAKNASGVWQFGGESDTQGGLTRTVTVANVQRNEAGDIVESGGTEDYSTKKVTVTVSGEGIADYSLTTYLTYWSQKEWVQTDWSATAGSLYWQDANKIYTAGNLSTSTVNQLTLGTASGGGWEDWTDLTADVSTSTVGVPKGMAFSADGNTMYVVGDATHDFRAYDISDIRSGDIWLLWSVNISEFSSGGTTVVLNPNGDYAYIGNASHGATGSTKSIAIIDLSTHTYTTLAGQAASFRDAWLVMDPDGNYLYAFEGYGKAYIYAISDGGATLTTVNTGQQLTYNTSWRLNPAWRDTNYTDEKWFFSMAGDYNTGVYYDFRKMYHRTSDHQFVVQYGVQEASSGMFRDVHYLDNGGTSGHSRYVVISTVSNAEFKIYEDDLSGITLLDSINPTVGATFMGIALDGDGMAFIYSNGYLVQMDISDPTNISEVANTATTAGVNAQPMKQIWYNDTVGGLFYIQYNSLGGSKSINFVQRPGTAGSGGYLSNGFATSSIFDIGSSDQTLSEVTVEQNVPSGCDLDIDVQASDSADFASYVSQTFSDFSGSSFTSTTPADLNSKRFLRYVAHMEPCTTVSANDTTPTLYSFKLRYK